jgi:hypothetical protein
MSSCTAISFKNISVDYWVDTLLLFLLYPLSSFLDFQITEWVGDLISTKGQRKDELMFKSLSFD